MRKLTVLILAIATVMALTVVACAEDEPTATPESMADPVETVIFSDLSWDSAQIQNRIAQYIVEKGYGYQTEVKFGDTIPLLEGLERGDQHVTMEIWLPNQNAPWERSLESGVVQQVGYSLGRDWQSAFVIPKYLQEEYPDLDSVEDLKEAQYKDLFDTPETDGKARLLSCLPGWACAGVNRAQVAAYGLEEHVHLIEPGSGAAANADLYGAYEREEPWLGYQWGTNTPALVLDLVLLEEPAYNEECWTGIQNWIEAGAADAPLAEGCGYEDAEIVIAVRTELADGNPELIDMFENWGFDIAEYGTVAAWRGDNENADIADAATWWLNTNRDVWSTWVTTEAATAINAALDAGEVPAGWPTE